MENNNQTPNLSTALTGPMQLLEKQLIEKQAEIEAWFEQEWQKSPAPVYGSVDLRNAGFKLAPVDMNLFPAGFNNIRLNKEFMPIARDAFNNVVARIAPAAKNILLIPENHTRNLFYWENVDALLEIISSAGFQVRLGSLSPDISTATTIELANGKKLTLNPIVRDGANIRITEYLPDLILLNNDLSDGIPEILLGVSQIVSPPAELGWSQRLKSEHFQYYAQVSGEFSRMLKLDPWFISPLFRHCGNIDFMQREGETCLVSNVEKLFSELEEKYKQHEIKHPPYIVIKADAGTYGMAIMMVKNIDEVRSLNRKQRTHMSKVKGGKPVHSVIIQEGVYTFETWGKENTVAEPVVYLIGERVIGGFYRVHHNRGIDENLNAPGMQFEPLVFQKPCHQPSKILGECQNRFYAYGVIARLSMLAAAREILEEKKGS